MIELLDPQMSQRQCAEQIFALIMEIPHGIRIVGAVLVQVLRGSPHRMLAVLHEACGRPDDGSGGAHDAKFHKLIVSHALPHGTATEPMLQAVLLAL